MLGGGGGETSSLHNTIISDKLLVEQSSAIKVFVCALPQATPTAEAAMDTRESLKMMREEREQPRTLDHQVQTTMDK